MAEHLRPRRRGITSLGRDDSVVVIGLGRFGQALALELAESGVDVLGIDTDETIVQDLNGRLTQVVRADATREEVVRAARMADIHERILRLPRGYDSVIGEDARLSCGEAQRIALARALLADTPVMVLDEATAFADPRTERAVRQALATAAGDRTVVVIAHRLETVMDADTVVMVEDGRVVERGRPGELLARDGRFAAFWRSHRPAQAARPETRTGDPQGDRP